MHFMIGTLYDLSQLSPLWFRYKPVSLIEDIEPTRIQWMDGWMDFFFFRGERAHFALNVSKKVK